MNPDRVPSRQKQNRGGILVQNQKTPLTASRASDGLKRHSERKLGDNGYFNKISLKPGINMPVINSRDAQTNVNTQSLNDNLSQSTQVGNKPE